LIAWASSSSVVSSAIFVVKVIHGSVRYLLLSPFAFSVSATGYATALL